MDEVKKLLMSGEGNKLTKKTYKVAVAEEKRRLLRKLVFTLVVFKELDFIIAVSCKY